MLVLTIHVGGVVENIHSAVVVHCWLMEIRLRPLGKCALHVGIHPECGVRNAHGKSPTILQNSMALFHYGKHGFRVRKMLEHMRCIDLVDRGRRKGKRKPGQVEVDIRPSQIDTDPAWLLLPAGPNSTQILSPESTLLKVLLFLNLVTKEVPRRIGDAIKRGRTIFFSRYIITIAILLYASMPRRSSTRHSSVP